jgi:hypothetical protein
MDKVSTVLKALNASKQLSDTLNTQNESVVRAQIEKMTSDFKPYVATTQVVNRILTDFDHFPYRRWHRTNPVDNFPTIVERESGWRPQQQQCYESAGIVTVSGTHSQDVEKYSVPNNAVGTDSAYPTTCFSPACNSVFPCYFKSGNKQSRNVVDVTQLGY